MLAIMRLRIESVTGLPPIHAPVEELLHSLYALVKNALDASALGEDVRIRLSREREVMCIAVQDSGEGMPATVLARAGEPFFTTKEPGRGLGLGLFLTRAFAESQGGALSLESVEGRGTLAVLKLPVEPGAVA